MNYEQKYNEALERAKEWMAGKYGHYVSDTPQEIAEFIFPELKESEDEQIRKELLEHCINRRDGKQVCVDANDYRRWADWLEKQGQSKKTSIWKHWKDGIAGSGDSIPAYLIKNGLTYSLSPYLSSECDYIELSELDSLMLEKQSEQKPQDKSALEAIKEEKVDNAKKVESKFHEGDFIKHNKINIICKVISVNSGSYYVENIETSSRIKLFNTEQNFHLWTVEDAKNGDVLVASDNSVFIFARVDGHACIHHIALTSDGTLKINPRLISAWESVKGVKPATKEQRDLLFVKMHDADYEWDVDKRELTKE